MSSGRSAAWSAATHSYWLPARSGDRDLGRRGPEAARRCFRWAADRLGSWSSWRNNWPAGACGARHRSGSGVDRAAAVQPSAGPRRRAMRLPYCVLDQMAPDDGQTQPLFVLQHLHGLAAATRAWPRGPAAGTGPHRTRAMGARPADMLLRQPVRDSSLGPPGSPRRPGRMRSHCARGLSHRASEHRIGRHCTPGSTPPSRAPDAPNASEQR
jgi:hypothetical protein